jgi:hypothetical protein
VNGARRGSCQQPATRQVIERYNTSMYAVHSMRMVMCQVDGDTHTFPGKGSPELADVRQTRLAFRGYLPATQFGFACISQLGTGSASAPT